jgi:hypothetical protein
MAGPIRSVAVLPFENLRNFASPNTGFNVDVADFQASSTWQAVCAGIGCLHHTRSIPKKRVICLAFPCTMM